MRSKEMCLLGALMAAEGPLRAQEPGASDEVPRMEVVVFGPRETGMRIRAALDASPAIRALPVQLVGGPSRARVVAQDRAGEQDRAYVDASTSTPGRLQVLVLYGPTRRVYLRSLEGALDTVLLERLVQHLAATVDALRVGARPGVPAREAQPELERRGWALPSEGRAQGISAGWETVWLGRRAVRYGPTLRYRVTVAGPLRAWLEGGLQRLRHRARQVDLALWGLALRGGLALSVGGRVRGVLRAGLGIRAERGRARANPADWFTEAPSWHLEPIFGLLGSLDVALHRRLRAVLDAGMEVALQPLAYVVDAGGERLGLLGARRIRPRAALRLEATF